MRGDVKPDKIRRIMKRILLYLAVVAVSALCFVSCSSEKEFNEQFLIGYWKMGTDNMRFDAAHTGEWWDTSEDVEEGEGNKFQWTLDGESFLIDICFQEVGGCDVPKPFTMVELTETTLRYTDFTGKTRTYTKYQK